MTRHFRGKLQYPLGEQQPEEIRSRTGRFLNDITLETVRAGQIQPEDLTIHSETLRKQAQIAAMAGYIHLATNLRRAAELVDIPNERLLLIYNALRPHRSTYQDLLDLATELVTLYGAKENADFVRQAADAYRSAEMLRSDGE